MTIIHRRVFYARFGTAGSLVTLLKEAGGLMQKAGFSFKSRYLIDFLSGRNDRVSMEWEVEGPGEIAGLYQSFRSPKI